jgi:hypothetical protein
MRGKLEIQFFGKGQEKKERKEREREEGKISGGRFWFFFGGDFSFKTSQWDARTKSK